MQVELSQLYTHRRTQLPSKSSQRFYCIMHCCIWHCVMWCRIMWHCSMWCCIIWLCIMCFQLRSVASTETFNGNQALCCFALYAALAHITLCRYFYNKRIAMCISFYIVFWKNVLSAYFTLYGIFRVWPLCITLPSMLFLEYGHSAYFTLYGMCMIGKPRIKEVEEYNIFGIGKFGITLEISFP